MDTYTIPAPESGSTIFTNEVWKAHKGPTRLILAEGWTQIGNAAFYGAIELLTIHIPKSVEAIQDEAFSRATSLREVIFEQDSRLVYIGAAAFYGTTSLRMIRIPDSVNEIGMVAFSSATSLETFYVPKLVEVLPQGMFMGSTSLREIKFDADSLLKTVQLGVFSGATALRTIHIPAGVTDIENEAFGNTQMLKEITFVPSSQISRIGYQAFKGSGLTTVVLGRHLLARLNAARRASYMKPLTLGKNNFYGKDNVNIVSMAQQINTMHLIAKQTSTALPTHVTNKIGQILTGMTPKRSDLVKESSARAMGIRRKSNKRKMKTKKGKSKRRRTMSRK